MSEKKPHENLTVSCQLFEIVCLDCGYVDYSDDLSDTPAHACTKDQKKRAQAFDDWRETGIEPASFPWKQNHPGEGIIDPNLWSNATPRVQHEIKNEFVDLVDPDDGFNVWRKKGIQVLFDDRMPPGEIIFLTGKPLINTTVKGVTKMNVNKEDLKNIDESTLTLFQMCFQHIGRGDVSDMIEKELASRIAAPPDVIKPEEKEGKPIARRGK